MVDISSDPRVTDAPAPAYGAPLGADGAIAAAPARTVFGQVMGLVAVTVEFVALGAYIGRDLGGGTGIVALIAAFACIIGLNVASARGHEQLAIGLLLGMGLLLGSCRRPGQTGRCMPGPTDPCSGRPPARPPPSSRHSGSYGYATRRDLSTWARTLFWALLGLIVLGIVPHSFVSIPHAHIVYAVAGLAIFGAFTIFLNSTACADRRQPVR